MNEGYIKLYRELLEKPIWLNSTPEQRVILITLLLMANHKGAEWDYNGRKFRVYPGQFVTSLEGIRRRCNSPDITIMKIRTAIARFEKLEFLTSQITNRYRLITIVNWRFYQCDDGELNKQNNKHLTSTQQALNKHLTTNNNNNNNKNNNNEININNAKALFVASDEATAAVVSAWNELECYGIKPVRKIIAESTRDKQLKARLRQYSTEEVLKAIKNISQSKFLQGHGKNGWTVTFDWFIKPNNFIKVLEGNYNDTEPKQQEQFGVNL